MTGLRLAVVVCGFVVRVAASVLVMWGIAAADTVKVDGFIGFQNVQIQPQVGTIEFLAPWTAEALAAVNGSGVFDSAVGGAAEVTREGDFASAHAIADATDLRGTADSHVFIPGCTPGAATAVGRASLFNTFVLTEGEGTVAVDFSVSLGGLQDLRTDACGVLADSEIVFGMELDGTPVLFFQSRKTIGPSSVFKQSITESLHTTIVLSFGIPYFIFFEADAETLGVNQTIPEPRAPALIVIGLSTLAGWLRKQHRRRTT